jgi:hypothetical protein
MPVFSTNSQTIFDSVDLRRFEFHRKVGVNPRLKNAVIVYSDDLRVDGLAIKTGNGFRVGRRLYGLHGYELYNFYTGDRMSYADLI